MIPDPFPKEVERFRDGFELLGSTLWPQCLNARILLAHRDPQTEIFAEPVAMSLCLDSDLRPFEDGVADFLGGP